jgi:hypothetical protein
MPELASSLERRLLADLAVTDQQGLYTRVAPDQVTVEVDALGPSLNGFTAEVTITAVGNIHHMGHPDTRVNRYRGSIHLAKDGGHWKLSQMDVREHRKM